MIFRAIFALWSSRLIFCESTIRYSIVAIRLICSKFGRR